MKVTLVLLVLSSVILASCEKEEDLYALNPTLTIVGNWEWQSSCGGFAGTCYTPASTDSYSTIEFTADSVVNVYLYDSLTLQSKFSIVHEVSTITGDSAALLVYEDVSFKKLFTIKADGSLLLVDECADCFSSEYKRLRE
jgi:hypothetical protein